MSTSKARSLAIFVPVGAVLIISAFMAAPWMSAIPTAYAAGSCDPRYDKNCPPDNGNNNRKVTICHIPPGNPDNAHTIRVSENAVDAHLAHGDTLGKCPTRK
jgi:hypothetical protein